MLSTVLQYLSSTCGGGNFFGLPKWWAYLDGENVKGICRPKLNGLSDLWLIVAAVVEMLLRVSAMVAVAFVIYGGFTLMTSQGDPKKAAEGRATLINALVGLGIAVTAAATISFVAKSIN